MSPPASASSVPDFTPAATPPDVIEPGQVIWRRLATAVLIFAAILFFVRIGARALWASEFRWAEIAREMLATGNYFWPTIDNRPYFDKPLGTYWLVVGAARALGTMDEAAARIPCAIAGLLGVAVLMSIARRLYDWKVAAWSGFILATSYSFVFFSRHASADVETVTGELIALALFLHNEKRRGGMWVVALWIVMALTSQTKGLLGFVLPILIIGAYSCFAQGWDDLRDHFLRGGVSARIRWFIERNRWFFNWTTAPAMALAAIIYVAPFVISQRLMHSDRGLYLVYRENVVRYFEPFDHKGPIYLYLFVIFLLMAPWSILLPGALAQIHGGDGKDDRSTRADRFAKVFFWSIFVFFTLSGSRRSYYLLPILPAAALIVARLITSPKELLTPLAWWLTKIGYIGLAIGTILSVLALLPPAWILPHPLDLMPTLPYPLVYTALWSVAIIGVVYALRELRPDRIAASVGMIAYLAMAYIYMFAMPAAEAYRGEKPFARVVMAKVGPDLSKLVFFRNLETFFYLEPYRPLPLFSFPMGVQRAIEHGDAEWVIVRRRDLSDLNLPGTIVAEEANFPWQGAKGVRNSVVLIKLGSPPAPK
ncbi:MAG: glycosyltransferase family 39 protein [Candidatus Binataceae bacterium]|nr:glycosyltransferase family 39 protein [Candidatus Binataceae bacterium]